MLNYKKKAAHSIFFFRTIYHFLVKINVIEFNVPRFFCQLKCSVPLNTLIATDAMKESNNAWTILRIF